MQIRYNNLPSGFTDPSALWNPQNKTYKRSCELVLTPWNGASFLQSYQRCECEHLSLGFLPWNCWNSSQMWDWEPSLSLSVFVGLLGPSSPWPSCVRLLSNFPAVGSLWRLFRAHFRCSSFAAVVPLGSSFKCPRLPVSRKDFLFPSCCWMMLSVLP